MPYSWNTTTAELNVSPRQRIDTEQVSPFTMLFCSFSIGLDGSATILNGVGFSGIVQFGVGSYIISTSVAYDNFYYANFTWASSSTTNPINWIINRTRSNQTDLAVFFLVNGVATKPPSGCQFYLMQIVGQPV